MKFIPSFFYCYVLFCLVSCKKKETLFEVVPSSYSGITFINKVVENDSINPLDKLNIYNGGGVGIGDFNNDGLQDIFLVGNQVSNRLYINKGNMKFIDVTKEAGVGGFGGWGRGVAVVDINNDGLPDIYVCNTLLTDSTKRRNLLYINKGADKNGVPRFKEMAKEYGLDINLHSTMASFFDYDNDGDLDMYLAVNNAESSDNTSTFRPVLRDGTGKCRGRLYSNDWDPVLKHPVFHDVSKQAGILIEGYGHAVTTVDINRDGWKDIYVTNDFLSENILYINNHDGTFTDRSKEYFKHTSNSAMGQDIEDINNDGLADVFELDMFPEDNFRKKMFMSSNSYQTYMNFDHYGYQYQYNRNTLQINQGPRLGQNDSIGEPAFSETSFLSGVSQTDWSWCPLITDFDNDGFRDIVISNGYPRDVTDHDFTTFRNQAYLIASKKQILDQIPSVKIPNYAFKNNGNLQFTDVTKDWGLDVPTFSNGAAYADLDNDGDMDMIINNINDEVLIYKNTTREKGHSHYLHIKFKGGSSNHDGIGAWADIYYGHGKHQVYENTPYRGFLSTIQNIAHFGLGKEALLDSVVIRWQNNKKQTLKNIKADQLLKVDIVNAKESYTFSSPRINTQSLFKEVTQSVGVNYIHQESDLADFNIQKLIPHKLSQYTPALAVGDVDGNGYDDMVIGGTSKYPAQLLLQQPNGKFTQRDLLPKEINKLNGHIKDEGLLLFDANGDGYLDLYVASGGYKEAPGSPFYQDRLYINDGKGNFSEAIDALPKNFTSKLCVKATDYNKDGKLDLFVSGRVEPWNYPKPVSSIILRNDSKDGHIKFTDVTATVANDLTNIGLVCDAIFTDFDNDGWPDLILTGEWMPLTFLKNQQGVFRNVTSQSGIADKFGWWNSIVAGDFEHNGKTSYIVGNVGLNTFYKASDQYPVYITAKDFDHNGSYDAFTSLFLKDKEGELKEFPVNTRDDIIKQIIGMRVKFQNYKQYAEAPMDSVITSEMRKDAIRLKANMMQSCYIKNNGNGKFSMIPLPIEAQTSQLNGMVVDDFDGDGNLDIAISGNDYGTETMSGRYDAFNGLLLRGDGKGVFKPLTIQQSGLYIPGDGKALVRLMGAKNNYLLAASQNRGPLKIFELKIPVQTVKIQQLDAYCIIKYKNGKTSKQEFYNGTSFLSQSARFVKIDKTMDSIIITDNKGQSRNISLK